VVQSLSRRILRFCCRNTCWDFGGAGFLKFDKQMGKKDGRVSGVVLLITFLYVV
jgi:hypothetical protein